MSRQIDIIIQFVIKINFISWTESWREIFVKLFETHANTKTIDDKQKKMK